MQRVRSSFRDPSGFVYQKEGIYYRKVSEDYLPILTKLMQSGLLRELLKSKSLLSFSRIDDTILPEQLPFISYPYEWSFSMLKEAALLTLRTHLLCLEHDMVLKDASAYNVQFVNSKPILIDHLSFYPYTEGEPWIAYGQFCRHFLYPLLLASCVDVNLLQLLRIYLDGIPAKLTWKLLPWKKKLSMINILHVKLNALDRKVKKIPYLSKFKHEVLISGLTTIVDMLKWKPTAGWKDYKEIWNYEDASVHSKADIIRMYCDRLGTTTIADLGANTGMYSDLMANKGNKVIAVDSDPACIELCYTERKNRNILPIVVDLTNPSPSIGWEGAERDSFISRLNVDTVVALALIHHLAIGNNLPLDRISSFLANLSSFLIIEFVPKEDSQVQKMLEFREDIFPNYTKEGFEKVFKKDFTILDSQRIEGTVRDLYLMKVK